jgi:predicted GIY-YIG superfamily endonuclease
MSRLLISKIIELRDYELYPKVSRSKRTKYFKQQNCIYILWNNDSVVYVGQTNNFGQRVKCHYPKVWNFFSLIHVDDYVERSMKELLLIDYYQPHYNRDACQSPSSITKSHKTLELQTLMSKRHWETIA